MGYLLGQHWLAVLIALAIGGLVGMLTSAPGDAHGRFGGWTRWGAGAYLVALLLVLTKLLPGRLGYWLDTAVLLTSAYLAGCLLSGLWTALEAGIFPRALLAGAPTWRPVLAGAPGDAGGFPREALSAWDAAAPVPQPAPVRVQPAPAPLPPAAAPAVAAPEPAPATEPASFAAAAAVPDEAVFPGERPESLPRPSDGAIDDLKRISGIGKQNEARLHGLGIWRFAQIAAWTEDNVRWVSGYLAFRGRIEREKWVEQARVLAAGGETEFSRRADRGEVATSRDDGSHGRANVEVASSREGDETPV
jgi:predicted flap endonuclease-1-like 5' DNA nuclease